MISEKNYLLIDTSSPFCFVSAWASDGRVIEKLSRSKQSHNEDLMPLVSECLQSLGLELKDIDGAIVGRGPGSFTGLRIGFSMLKGIASVKNMNVIAVPSFELFACPFLSKTDSVLIIADARREEFFSACYKLNSVGEVVETGQLGIRSLNELQDLVSELDIKRAIGTLDHLPAGLALDYQNLTVFGQAYKDYSRGRIEHSSAVSIEELVEIEPLYLRLVAARTIKERKSA